MEIDDATAKRLGWTPEDLAGILSERNRILPAGSLKVGGKSVRLRPLSEFRTVEEGVKAYMEALEV